MKEYTDRYIRENYARLAKAFRDYEAKINEKGNSSLDKLNDTMLSLYEREEVFSNYEAFCQWANQKFGMRTKRKTRRCVREATRNTAG